ncbi:ewing's tumor-associated antigen 1 [Triplophysa rosa]|uniref:Ewing'aposs tumor-associated antigen 1 n=1 Tax=Triplophysa rosa TaxID=992332 RepID=A0A9W7WN70_TRIRA|nr:ewing's tumor-associated antigen 1 [Triplophysa rosa]XP_057198618.1 ewing's tumor-associated antigen 1 [Triplophysa rosa]KAI7805297.1 putative ewing'aposs tumor-associated antigen 1 [Triplophysa rosa]
MTDKRNIGLRHKVGVRESHSRKSCPNSYNCRKDFTTPKRRPRIRFNGCYRGDSPNETETLQDIIWDPNSPTQNFNGKGANGRVIEISEIVNRIAPKVDGPKEGDSVLQWIGDNAIPCTPEVKQPRVRRISSRQSNVEDLMKLAKQFDINMTRQDKERQQNATEVDGPTQHLSGRLSPPSVNCTPEIRPDPSESGSCSSAVRNAPVNAPKATVKGCDDDWENDDLLNDSFVLEINQNEVPSNVVQKPECSSRNIAAETNPSVSNGRGVCQQIQKSTNKSSTFTRTLPEGQTSVQSTSRVKPPTSAQNQTTKKLLKTSLEGKQPAQSSHGNKQTELNRASKDCRSSVQPSTSKFQGLSREDLKSLFDSDSLWNDDEDDDLLCQACDDVERISASQEQQRQSMGFTEPTHNTSKAPSSADTIQAQTLRVNGKSQPAQATTSTRAFVRSNSLPCSSGSSGFNQNSAAGGFKPGSVRATSETILPQGTKVGNAPNSRNFTFKRHLSDSVTLTNKVFVSSNGTVKCSAAEIERKKQEAIARRRSRMLADQKQGAPT